jgi:hypothetical protein
MISFQSNKKKTNDLVLDISRDLDLLRILKQYVIHGLIIIILTRFVTLFLKSFSSFVSTIRCWQATNPTNVKDAG